MFKFILVVISFLCFVACQSEAKMGDGSGKLTPPASDADQLKLGVKIKLNNPKSVSSAEIVKAFESQLPIFEPCINKAGKEEVVRLESSFKIDKNGQIRTYNVLEVVPDSKMFFECFINNIRRLEFGRKRHEITGIMTLGTYYGRQSDWYSDPERRD